MTIGLVMFTGLLMQMGIELLLSVVVCKREGAKKPVGRLARVMRAPAWLEEGRRTHRQLHPCSACWECRAQARASMPMAVHVPR